MRKTHLSFPAIFLLASTLAFPPQSQASEGQPQLAHPHDCGETLPSASVEGNERSRAMACKGLERAVAFFTAHHLELKFDETPIVYKFPKEVRLPCETAGCSGQRVAGLYDSETKTIYATRFDEPWMRSKARHYFSLPYNEELYISVLAHESTHALNKQFYTYLPDSHAQDEYIAYASQLWSMDSKLRDAILRIYPAPKNEFGNEGAINDIIHAIVPHRFGVMSYRHLQSQNGGETMLLRIYSGSFRPPSIE